MCIVTYFRRRKKLDALTTDEMFQGQRFAILAMFNYRVMYRTVEKQRKYNLRWFFFMIVLNQTILLDILAGSIKKCMCVSFVD